MTRMDAASRISSVSFLRARPKTGFFSHQGVRLVSLTNRPVVELAMT